MRREGTLHYNVVFTRTTGQERLCGRLNAAIPKDRGEAFIPKMEWWRRDRKEIEIKPLFPGYVFVRSDLDLRELHELVVAGRRDQSLYVRELGLSERRKDERGDPFEEGDARARDLTPEEAAFLDRMLDDEGIMRMSVGYRGPQGVVVARGPLKAYEKQIVNVDRHNRRAFLGLSFFGRVVRAGLEVAPKRRLFPNDEDAPELLCDGSEVDLKDLEKRMMGG